MARPLQFLHLLSRFSAPCVTPSVYLSGVRFSSKGNSKAWVGQNQVSTDGSRKSRFNDDGESELEELEDKLETVLDEERRRQRSMKYDMIRRKMTPPGSPQRKLTWDAIEQIRYLKQEQPEEWTIERLAEGFSVSSDVILRVLKSKFTPSTIRKAKQDAKVMARLGQQVLPPDSRTQEKQLKLPQNQTPAILASRGTEDALISVTSQTPMIQSKGLGSPLTVQHPKLTGGICKDATLTWSTVDEGDAGAKPTEEDEECWDGQLLTEEELEELLEMDKPSPVVQVGNNFFDAEGNFLYKI
ncbi:neugrin [Fundulus heteroclitus]|uniref:Neugrin n=1 Tax=Fundulus heteroclitus TaxID=8078 RepID=A0A3Q2SVF1_FUNHE|nr:neugrin [Fundulus heteroclitus]